MTSVFASSAARNGNCARSKNGIAGKPRHVELIATRRYRASTCRATIDAASRQRAASAAGNAASKLGELARQVARRAPRHARSTTSRACSSSRRRFAGQCARRRRDLERVREHRRGARARAEALEPAALREQRRQEIRVDRAAPPRWPRARLRRRRDAGRPRTASSARAGRSARACAPRVSSSCAAAPSPRFSACTPRLNSARGCCGSRLRTSSQTCSASSQRPGARQSARVLDELLDAAGHAVSVADSRRRRPPKKDGGPKPAVRVVAESGSERHVQLHRVHRAEQCRTTLGNVLPELKSVEAASLPTTGGSSSVTFIAPKLSEYLSANR